VAARPEPFRCTTCGATALRWTGQCATCGEWNTLEELSGDAAQVARVVLEPVIVRDAAPGAPASIPLGLSEIERVLGGGLEPGSVTLVAGAPGIGKSTLCTQLAVFAAATGHAALVVAAEESLAQVARRTTRLGGGAAEVSVLATSNLAEALGALEATEASLCVVDSVSTMSDPAVRSLSGGVVQVRHAAEQLSAVARRRQIALLLVGHVTKDGDLAGPRALEHLVDTVMTIEGDRHHARRVVTTVKHRFGPAGEVGILELGADGLVSVDDPSATMLAERGATLAGSVATVLAEGLRPLVVEIQALVTPAVSAPARVAQGVSATRLRQLGAVLDAHCDLGIARSDLFVACSGAVRATEPAVDVAVIAAIVSAFFGAPLDPRVVSIGEVGLTGSIRSVLSARRRLEEASRVGLEVAIVPPGTEVPAGVEPVEVATVSELVAAVHAHSVANR
jgi:DNA repair protein RadA/Sms